MIYFWGRTDLLAKNMGAYRLHVTKDLTAATNDQLKHKRVLHYWCFSPGLAMEQLVELQVRCHGPQSLTSLLVVLKRFFPSDCANKILLQRSIPSRVACISQAIISPTPPYTSGFL